jgi:curved DNA-binding protein CbpA
MPTCLNATTLHPIVQVKDYYKILELPPSAGLDDVKRNFRRLALQYHPDTNQGKKHADAWYSEIQEAYLILSDPLKKSRYLQERWLVKSKGIPFADTLPLTPEYIEMRFKTMRSSVSFMDHFRMDHIGLQTQLLELCNDETLDALKKHNDQDKNALIVHHLLASMAPLSFSHLPLLIKAAQKIASAQPTLLRHIDKWYRQRKRENWWDKKQGWIIAGITIILCLLIAMVSKPI